MIDELLCILLMTYFVIIFAATMNMYENLIDKMAEVDEMSEEEVFGINNLIEETIKLKEELERSEEKYNELKKEHQRLLDNYDAAFERRRNE